LTVESLDMKRATALYDTAMEQLQVGAYQDALELGAEMIKLPFSGGFEVAAIAYAGLGRLDQAIFVLQKGVQGEYVAGQQEMEGTLEIFEVGNCLINMDKICWAQKKKNKVTIRFNDRFSLLDLKDEEAQAFWDRYRKMAHES